MEKALIFSLLFMLACKQQVEPVAPISEEEMINIMVDMAVVDSDVDLRKLNKPEKELKLKIQYQKGVLKEHNVSVETFDEALTYYMNNVEQFNGMYMIAIQRADSISNYKKNK